MLTSLDETVLDSYCCASFLAYSWLFNRFWVIDKSFYRSSVLLARLWVWTFSLVFYLVTAWLLNFPAIPLDFWSIKKGLNTFYFDSERLTTSLDFLSQSEEAEEFYLDWMFGRTKAGLLKILSFGKVLKVFSGVWFSLWHLNWPVEATLEMLWKPLSEGLATFWAVFCSNFLAEIYLRSGN